MKLQDIFIGLILILLVSSCETTERIDDFPLRPSKLVLNSLFTADSMWTFQVSKSLSVLDNAEIKLIDNALIEIYQDDNLIESVTQQDSDKWYRSVSTTPQAGIDYTVKVTAPGFGSTLIADSYVPQFVPVTEVEALIDTSNVGGDEWYYGSASAKMKISFSDPAAKDNYYQLSVIAVDTTEYFYNEEWIKENYYSSRYLSSDDPAISNADGDYYSTLLFYDEYFNGKDYILEVEFEEWEYIPNRSYIIRLTSLSEESFNYFRSVMTYNNSQHDPFAEPVEIFSNIENGFGIFAGFSMSEKVYTLE